MFYVIFQNLILDVGVLTVNQPRTTESKLIYSKFFNQPKNPISLDNQEYI